MKTIGSAKLGFPVLVTTIIYGPDGSTTTSTQEVLELRGTAQCRLFEVPEGYMLAKNVQELYGMSAPSAGVASSSPSSSGANAASSSSSPGGVWATTDGPKKAGVIRIGLVMPKVQMSSGDTAQAAEALRGNFASYLKGPSVEVIPLSARLASQATQEALRASVTTYLLIAVGEKGRRLHVWPRNRQHRRFGGGSHPRWRICNGGSSTFGND